MKYVNVVASSLEHRRNSEPGSCPQLCRAQQSSLFRCLKSNCFDLVTLILLLLSFCHFPLLHF